MLTGLLCRMRRWLVRGAGAAAPSAKQTPSAAKEAPSVKEAKKEGKPADDLTVIRGIGVATQNRLNAVGIRSFDQLADAKPDEVRKNLGRLARGARVDAWIGQARQLAEKK